MSLALGARNRGDDLLRIAACIVQSLNPFPADAALGPELFGRGVKRP